MVCAELRTSTHTYIFTCHLIIISLQSLQPSSISVILQVSIMTFRNAKSKNQSLTQKITLQKQNKHRILMNEVWMELELGRYRLFEIDTI